MLRLEVAGLLRGDGVMLAALPGGIYPETDQQASVLSQQAYPEAFNAIDEVLPTLLVQDDGMFPLPITRGTVSDTFRLLVWQQRGRDAIDGALARAFALLNGARVNAGAAWVYEIQFAGEGPNIRDQALGDAELGWSRWQAVVLR